MLTRTLQPQVASLPVLPYVYALASGAALLPGGYACPEQQHVAVHWACMDDVRMCTAHCAGVGG